MYADLMRPAGFQLNVQQRESIVTLPHTIDAQRETAAGHHSHTGAVSRIACDRLINLTSGGGHMSVDQRDVIFENFAGAKLICELFVRRVGLRSEEHTSELQSP